MRPVLYVLAGVNGAGKSSVGGYLLELAGLTWFNPDTFARELKAATGGSQEQANGLAWEEGMRRLDDALASGTSYAFETTLGGNSVPNKILAATRTHDVLLWFCGLASPEQHISRVGAWVAAGGHDIPAQKIRQRYVSAQGNLIGLMPYVACLQVYDNSAEAAHGEAIPDPLLVLEMAGGRLLWPHSHHVQALRATPEWAGPLLEAALGAV